MCKLLKIRRLSQKKTPVSRFLPLPFRASYPLVWICSLPFRASYPSPLRSDVRRRVSFALPTPSGRALSRFLPPGLKFFRASYPVLSEADRIFGLFLCNFFLFIRTPFALPTPSPAAQPALFL
jgi:hypothetical protein